jgi:hypothetical protein
MKESESPKKCPWCLSSEDGVAPSYPSRQQLWAPLLRLLALLPPPNEKSVLQALEGILRVEPRQDSFGDITGQPTKVLSKGADEGVNELQSQQPIIIKYSFSYNSKNLTNDNPYAMGITGSGAPSGISVSNLVHSATFLQSLSFWRNNFRRRRKTMLCAKGQSIS